MIHSDIDRPAIRLRGVSKHYIPQNNSAVLIKAVDNVTVDIYRGSMTGLVGKNGCGKSTLLKMIAGISRPTTGTIEICGPLMAFTDFGAGFHPDLTGMENIYLTGGLYGLKKAQVKNLLPKIISFSELGNFLEMPVKNYSQGMFMRLAFSLMIHLPLEIVLLDEALAVGDEAFRNKCYKKIHDLIQQGLTILIVSHSYQEIAGLCDRCIVMDQGGVVADGKPEDVYNSYMDSIHIETNPQLSGMEDIESNLNILKPGYVRILSITVRNADNTKNDIDFASTIVISIVWEKLVKEGSVFFDMILSDRMNLPILATANYYNRPIDVINWRNQDKIGKFTSECFIRPYFLNHGLININFGGTMFYSRDSHFSLFVTKQPLSIIIKNSLQYSLDYYWFDSNAPIRTNMRWEETETLS